VNLLDSGPDLLLRTDAVLSAGDRARLANFARAHNLPRVSWSRGHEAPEPVCLLRPSHIRFGSIDVDPPPGAFLQASAEGEEAIVRAVLAGLPVSSRQARIAELYAGCGTITFALARHARVTAWEGDASAAGAIEMAARKAGLSGWISVERRDLARQPVLAQDLSAFAAAVLDPPYAGARAQITQIVASGIPRVIYVSCNPTALERDARCLYEAGYRLVAATPIDQFLWSARLESVVVFAR
jgi:23S rRNA (uracil1939-C5)-methyltransferase